MQLTNLLSVLALPLAGVVAAPTAGKQPSPSLFSTRQARRPAPCQRQNPPPTPEELKVRFDDFVQAFVGPTGTKNITKAFEYIVDDYIVSLSHLIYSSLT